MNVLKSNHIEKIIPNKKCLKEKVEFEKLSQLRIK